MTAILLNASTLTAAMALLIPALPTAAQNALGSGTALDANLNYGGTRYNQPLQQGESYRTRNLLITNSVVGGRGFRGSVGYTSEFDFRGDLGSDDLFDFRRDSAWSDVTFLNYGTTYQQLRFGQDMSLLEYSRTAQGAHIGMSAEDVYRDPVQRIEARMRLDQLTYVSGSTAATRVTAEPASVGYTMDEEGNPYTVQASTLRGLMTSRYDSNPQLLGLSTLDVVRLQEDAAEGHENPPIGQFFRVRYEDLLLDQPAEPSGLADWRVAGEPVGRSTQTDEQPEFKRILERIAARRMQQEDESEDAAAQPNVLEALDRDLEELRRYLVGLDRPGQEPGQQPGPDEPVPGLPPPDPMAEPQSAAEDENPFIRGLEDRGITSPLDPFQTETEDEPTGFDDEEESPYFTLQDAASVLRHGRTIERLATPEDESRFNQFMTAAEEHLRDGEYFRAEGRFVRALRFSPGHPLATAGLAHAQIGAGLYLSASITVRSLFAYRPEMIDARYQENLVPDDERLHAAVEILQRRLDIDRDRDAAALILAYVGHLLDEPDLIRRGLDALAEEKPDDRLLPLLRRIWLAPPAAPAPPIADDPSSEMTGDSRPEDP